MKAFDTTSTMYVYEIEKKYIYIKRGYTPIIILY